MNEAFAFIHEFVTWIASFIPHIGICATTHGGVRFRRGKKVRVIKPGLYVWMPICTEIKIICTVAKPIDLPSQALTSQDMKSIAVSITLTAEIEDVFKACTETEDVNNTIMDIAACAATPVIYKREFENTLKEYTKVLREILEEARKLLKPYGVKVLKAGITDITQSKVYRHIGDPQYSGGEEEE